MRGSRPEIRTCRTRFRQIVQIVRFDTFCAECVVLCGLIHSVRFMLQTGAPFGYDDKTVEPAVRSLKKK